MIDNPGLHGAASAVTSMAVVGIVIWLLLDAQPVILGTISGGAGAIVMALCAANFFRRR